MPLLLVTVGLPKSGKTTWARAFSNDHNAPIVNPDSIRLAIHGQRFIASAERFVWATAHAMVKALFLAGHECVIIDATNTTRRRRDEWQSPDWKTVFHVLEATKEECLSRAADDPEIIPIIERMASQWEPLGEGEVSGIPLGATGQFPDGSYGPDPSEDEGELRMALAADRKNSIVRLEFGKSVSWLGLQKETALQLAEKLQAQARKLD